MPQSYQSVPVHFIWSTKKRRALIKPDVEIQLYKYICAVFREHESPVIAINGWLDHIHVLSFLSRNISMAELIRNAKQYSSKWIKSKGFQYHNFYWQNGYAAFGVSKSGIDVVKRYIINQKMHHGRIAFEREYLDFLNKYSIPFDEKY